MFEAGSYAGGHTNTVDVDTEEGPIAVDTGFIVFNDRNYPNFTRLLDRLGVASQSSHMSFSVSDEAGRFEYSSSGANGLFARRRHLVDPSFYRMIRDLLRFNTELRGLVGANGSGPTVGRMLDEGGYSREFVERLIVPQISAVWSADPGQMESFPASFLAEFFDNHGVLDLTGRPKWRTVTGGSRRYVEALVRPFQERIHLLAPVKRVERAETGVRLWTADSGSLTFDAVVMACHSDQALAMLGDATPREREVLGAIGYQPNRVVLHDDHTVLPRRRRAWASWNYHLLDAPAAGTALTYNMNRLQSLQSRRQFCVTVNHVDGIDPESVIGAYEYSHPVYTREAVAAQSRHAEISGGRTHYCGAYWGSGFHEDGVVSAVRACERLGRFEL